MMVVTLSMCGRIGVMYLNRVKWFALTNSLQIICLSCLFIYFLSRREGLMAAFMLLIIALSLLILTLAELIGRVKEGR
jgi:hypothetical protein